LAATFGTEVGATTAQLNLLSSIGKVDLPDDEDLEATFPAAEDTQNYTSIRTMVDSIEIGMQSPMPRQHFTLALQLYPYLVKARKARDSMIHDRVQAAWEKFSHNADQDSLVKFAVDLAVQREAQMAKKENRLPMYDTQAIRHEFFGFIQAGHETTSTTICWAIKHLTAYQEVQARVREALRAAHRRAVEAGDGPTAQEIAKASVPCINAFIEENHRMGNTVPAVIRRATKDTVVLGYSIPKGTDVFMVSNGPNFQRPAFHIDKSKRTQSSRDMKDSYGVWNDADVSKFLPERGLVIGECGDVRFNSRAGPVQPFGAGVRGCFGS